MKTKEDVMVQETAGVATYTVDAAHSSVEFSVRHMGFTKVRGRFARYDAVVKLDPGALQTLSAETRIEVASVETGDAKRDAHLRSADFFDAETYPEMTFVSTEVRSVSASTFELAGDLTIHGVTRAVVLKGEYLGAGKDPWGNERVAFEASTRINREDFGLTWNQLLETGGVLVGKEVEISLQVQAVRQDA